MADLMEGILLAERSLFYTLNFELSGYPLMDRIGRYLAAVGAPVLVPFPEGVQPVQPLPEAEQQALVKWSMHMMNIV